MMEKRSACPEWESGCSRRDLPGHRELCLHTTGAMKGLNPRSPWQGYLCRRPCVLTCYRLFLPPLSEVMKDAAQEKCDLHVFTHAFVRDHALWNAP